eukprot:Seg1598.18 transcript_id=Seg1598.18/GoldUCD/mRNA.D3Y31 product="hypothetical protein" protein_id=Seg1598.18/GoldUCD/D3Y31
MDVVALYPSIDIDFSIDKCIEWMVEDAQEYNNVDVRELGLFLALTTTKTELEGRNLHKYCPTRPTKGRPPTITSSGTSKSEGKRWLGWIESEEKPTTEEEIRIMMLFAIGVSLRLVLKNHIFRFNNKLYKQTKGGAIGVGVAGDAANVFMIWWDRRLN